ncbi:ATP-binding protein [Sphingomonas parva]|uniref:ATP-binding protein n=1 Tax=Sphingomonas parva TaxID=2555898 RepID=A0A4Y8ZUQ1_9SPHN|nr:ATP-binding protein [Sphingomonas parva]TFI59197.1 ATP-binding protein [Sphingomonas parva]
MSEQSDTPNKLPEYAGNPFISALPPILSAVETLEFLSCPPLFDAAERALPGHLRKHCLMRLTRYMEPLTMQLELAERFDLVLRQGYVGRNPATGAHHRHVLAGAERVDAMDLSAICGVPLENTACGFALLGCPGMGKSKSFERILNRYPPVIVHEAPVSLTQLTWMKIDCPYKGSEKQLCIAFFAELDRQLGTSYSKAFASPRLATDHMMVHMAQKASLHGLGALVIDEIQHVNEAKCGPKAMLNFLVTLVNVIGIPVILVGTMGARGVIQDDFREARRAAGLGSLIWDRLPNDDVWNHFVEQMWRYQWTREYTPLTPEIQSVLYDESQGIIDVVVKLFMLAQFRAIARGELRQARELLSPSLLRRVAADEFKIIRPMIVAMRANDPKALSEYPDLRPLQDHVQNTLSGALRTEITTGDLKHAAQAAADKAAALAATTAQSGVDPMETAIRSVLTAAGMAGDVAEAAINEARRNSNDPFQILAAIKEMIETAPQKPDKRKKLDKAPFLEGDLRAIVAAGREKGESAYDALLAAGIIPRTISQALAA